jgi:hypothetical protein
MTHTTHPVAWNMILNVAEFIDAIPFVNNVDYWAELFVSLLSLLMFMILMCILLLYCLIVVVVRVYVLMDQIRRMHIDL